MAAGLAVALTGSALIASNMGFKLNYHLQAFSAGVSAQGVNTIALPNNRQSNINNAEDLMRDISGNNTISNVTLMSKYLNDSDTFQNYTGRKNATPPNTAFPLVAGEAYYAKMATTADYIVVGSHNPVLPYRLAKGGDSISGSGGPNSAQGVTFFAYNYNQTSQDAEALMRDISGNGTITNVTLVAKYLLASDTQQNYTGRKNATPPNTAFPLLPGEAYFIKMATTAPAYIPSHY
jgi:hypothetical protein